MHRDSHCHEVLLLLNPTIETRRALIYHPLNACECGAETAQLFLAPSLLFLVKIVSVLLPVKQGAQMDVL